MCNFLSGVITIPDHRILCGDLLHHEKTVSAYKLNPETYREWEWTADDSGESLIVRVAEEDSSWLKTQILTSYPSRSELLLECIRQVANVGCDLYLDGCTGLKALPENLKVGGYLSLGGCTGLTALPENLKGGGDLYLCGCTGLKALPENLKVGGYLSLSGCTGLKALPENLKVGCDLYLSGCTGLTA